MRSVPFVAGLHCIAVRPARTTSQHRQQLLQLALDAGDKTKEGPGFRTAYMLQALARQLPGSIAQTRTVLGLLDDGGKTELVPQIRCQNILDNNTTRGILYE